MAYAKQDELVVIAAGSFSKWIVASGSDVPCGSCRGCCRSSLLIHILPEETRTLARVSSEYLFPAPWLPEGHFLMGYDSEGRCPMLVDGECSIYEDRPQTCRDFDCRVFAATGVAVDERGHNEITDRVKAWAFDYENDASRARQEQFKDVAAFLRDNGDLFPQGSMPNYPEAMATLALRVFGLKLGAPPRQEDSDSVKARFARKIVARLMD